MEVNLNNFTLLHNHLMSILTTNNYQSEHLPQKIMQYIGMIVQSQKHLDMIEDFFDFFCQNAGNKIIRLTLQVDPLLSVKILSMLFINLRSQFWISYLLCQSFIIDAIQFQDIPKQQQWPQYYISLLKSLSIRLNYEQLSLFYNKKFSKFPLLYEALKYYNHPDCMVRTNVMNIILGIMKIKDQRLSKYFGRFPFTSYVITYCCQVKERISKFNEQLIKISKPNQEMDMKQMRSAHKSIVKMYYIDIIDYICYLNDLIQLGTEQLAHFVRNAILIYIVLPTLGYLSSSQFILCACHTLFLAFTLFKIVNDKLFKETLCLILMSKQLPSSIYNKIKQQKVYIPKVYSEDFLPSKYYWNKFDYQIQAECVKLFQDVNNFETEHENKKQNMQITNQFNEEITKISNSLGFNILNYKTQQNQVAFTQLSSLLGFNKQEKQQKNQQDIKLQQNTIRSSILQILSSSVLDINKDSAVLCCSVIINSFVISQDIDNEILKFSGLLMPRIDLKNYRDQFNIKSIQEFKDEAISFLSHVTKNAKLNQENAEFNKQDGVWFGVVTIKNMIIMLNNALYKQLQATEQQILLQFYKTSILELKQLISRKNMKWIVQNFEIEYSKMSRQAFVQGNSLPQSILIPRKSIKQVESDDSLDDPDIHCVSRLYFKESKQKVKYFIQKFALSQTLLLKYIEFSTNKINGTQQNKIFKELFKQKYNTLYAERYSKIEQKWKVGHNYEIGFRHMIQCFSHEKKSKLNKKLIIVQDKCNIIVVQPSSQQNTAKIMVNHPWKYVQAEIDRQTGKKMTIRLRQLIRGDTKIHLYFDSETKCAGSLQWMNSLKFERYQSQQAFILGYLKQCIAKI